MSVRGLQRDDGRRAEVSRDVGAARRVGVVVSRRWSTKF